ncbi:hypothetical protein [Apibacter adventoris]|nr:hypothetical protein [Apibacter adventoris]
MNDLTTTRLFSLLAEPSPVPNEEMQSAYVELVDEVKTQTQSETDYTQLFRLLNLTRIEFQALQTQILYEQGEKCA